MARATVILLLTGGLLMTGSVRCEVDRAAHGKRMRDGAIRDGDLNYNEKARLIDQAGDREKSRVRVAQASPEYAAALLDAGKQIDRANAVINAILDHQWLKEKGTRWYGNFFMFQDTGRPDDQNAVAFLSPWLCAYLLDHADKLTDQTRTRLRKALPLCLEALRVHTGPVHYDNIWFLKAASLVMIGLATEQSGLIREAETRIDEWIEYVSRNGINEFNSPTYAAVNIAALEVIWEYLPKSSGSFRKKTKQLLDVCYADVLQNWHWEADIGAGTHSRAYPRDRLTGKSLVSFLIRRQCGGRLRGSIRPFHYNFAVSDYVPPESVLTWGRKRGKTPLVLRASHPAWGHKDVRVDRSLYMIPEVTLASQTGYRANKDQAIPFKITYAGSRVEERASFITPVPAYADSYTRGAITFAHHQEGSRAIVLYEADIRKRKENAYLRLVIDPSESQEMIEEILVNAKPYEGNRRELKSGAVVAWRVGKAMVALRLLDSWGVDAANPSRHVAKHYALARTKALGLCLHGKVCYRPAKKVGVNDLSCGFVVHVGTKVEFGSLAKLSEQAAAWRVTEKREGATRDITWGVGRQTLRLCWRGEANKVSVRQTDGRKIGRFPLYESPLINLKRCGKVAVGSPAK